MHTTIFCSFEQLDFADLAMGHIRKIPGVKSIHYFSPHPVQRNSEPTAVVGGLGMFGGALGMYGGSLGMYGMKMETLNTDSTPAPSPVTSIKIHCDDSCRQKVIATLVNMHATGIVAMP